MAGINSSYVGEEGYNKYFRLAKLSYDCITYLMDNNELIWKLLKYNDPDAWKKADLTHAQKADLIYKGQEDATLSRVFLNVGQPDVWTSEDCIIRISPYQIDPDNRTVGNVSMAFEVFAHNKIDHLSNYQTRTATIAQQFLEVFNGAQLEGNGISRIYFDRLGNQNDRLLQGGQIPYKGYWILMSIKLG